MRQQQSDPSETVMKDKMSKLIVIDASVAIKWYIAEPDSLKAKIWYNRIQTGKILAVIPDYFYLECCNVFLKRYRIAQEECKAVLRDIEQLGLEVVPLSILKMSQVITLSSKYNITMYDAVYLEVARIAEAKVVTADEILALRAPKLTQLL